MFALIMILASAASAHVVDPKGLVRTPTGATVANASNINSAQSRAVVATGVDQGLL